MSIEMSTDLSLFPHFIGPPAMGRSPAGKPGGRPSIKIRRSTSMRKTIHRFVRRAAFVVVGAALLVPMAVAAADTSIQPLSATLVARVAEVDVTVSFTCPAGDTVGNPYGMPYGGASIYLQQAVTKTEQAAGSGFTNGQTCT